MSKKKISGTLEWSVASLNMHLGCAHRCRYCYARATAVRHHLCTMDEWGNTYNRLKDHPFTGFDKHYPGVVMFPTTHDLMADQLPQIVEGLKRLVAAGNTILLVTKPHLDVVKAICEKFADHKDQIRWRMTIGAWQDSTLHYWEPGAPGFQERLASLRFAFEAGFSTSVSAEPMLDGQDVLHLFTRLIPYVSDTFWIGKMNNIRRKDGSLWRVQPDTDPQEIARIEAGQTDERIREIYEALKDEPKIRWKESFKSVLGLELATEPGQDI